MYLPFIILRLNPLLWVALSITVFCVMEFSEEQEQNHVLKISSSLVMLLLCMRRHHYYVQNKAEKNVIP
jgi:hypothetical protein